MDVINKFFNQNEDLVLANKLNNFKTNLLSASVNKNGNRLGMEEKISNEAKEYWATIDLYNNSKLAFNKRCKSVKLKRDKLNVEIGKRKTGGLGRLEEQEQNEIGENAKEVKADQMELCSCVKCSIVYHEAMIKGITDINAIVCKKCSNKLIGCKCCSSNLSSASLASSSRASIENLESQTKTVLGGLEGGPKAKQSPVKDEFTQFDEKLFNIKNELVGFFIFADFGFIESIQFLEF